MDSWEFNKIAGAVLAALLVAFGSGTLAGIITGEGHGGGHGDGHAKPGYELPVTAAPAGGAGQPAAVAFKPDEVVALLKGASAENGQGVFKRCASCHTSDKGDAKKLQGPNLFGVIGRNKATVAGFNYSSAMKAQKGAWSFADMASYLHNPRQAVPGNKMAFAGIDNNNDLADLLAFLRSKADQPAPLP